MMRIRLAGFPLRVSLITAALVLLALAPGLARAAARSAGLGGSGWGRAQEIVGAGWLAKVPVNFGPFLSCASAGACTLAGTVVNRTIHDVPFAASEVRGVWGHAIALPGFATLDHGRNAVLASVSCGSAGNCLAGGWYGSPAGHALPWVAARVHGRWQAALELPGMAAFNAGRSAQITSVSCPVAGNCLVGGSYRDASRHTTQAFVASDVAGTWQAPVELPGSGALNTGGNAQVTEVSCSAAGSCAAIGTYSDMPGQLFGDHMFVASQVRGIWQAAIEVAGLTNFPIVTSLSCGPAGQCAAGGAFWAKPGQRHAFVVSRAHGTWGAAQGVRGVTPIPRFQTDSAVESVSCAKGGCAAAGSYRDGHGFYQAFVVSQSHGAWGRASQPPGLARLNLGRSAATSAISCRSAGNCVAGGGYASRRFRSTVQAFVATEVHGTWQRALELPGVAALNTGGSAWVAAVSCPAVGPCRAAGHYLRRPISYRGLFPNQRDFVASQR